MWWIRAASQGNESAAKNRDKVAKGITTADISKAQDLVREGVAKTTRGAE